MILITALKSLKLYIITVGDGASHFCNVIISGTINESVSGRAHRKKSKWEKVINKLAFFDKDHCRVSHYNDVKQALDFLKGKEL